MFVFSVAQDTRGAGHCQISWLFRNLFYNLTIGKVEYSHAAVVNWWRIWILKYWNVCWWVATGGAGWVNATNEPCSVNHILSSHIVLINARIQVSFRQFKQFQVVDTCSLPSVLIKT